MSRVADRWKHNSKPNASRLLAYRRLRVRNYVCVCFFFLKKKKIESGTRLLGICVLDLWLPFFFFFFEKK
jgi:hypothetical protein